jgi:drug/metabolite transporter (DMT)-like permease
MAIENSRREKVLCGAVLGGLLGGLTFALPKLSSLSEHPVVETVQRCTVALLLPGIIGAGAASGNVHAWPMWLAAGLNAVLYFVVGWLLWWIGAQLLRSRA